jgi:hypothetical protein
MFQPDFYNQPQQPQQGPTSLDFLNTQMQRIKQRTAPPSLSPGSRAVDIQQGIADPSNFQSYYRQLASIKQIGQEQVARAQAEATLASIRASQALNQSVARSSSGGGKSMPSTTNVGSVPSTPAANFKFAQNIAGNFGWNSPSELAAWYTLGMKESGWRNNAQNPTSTAFGIGQFLDSTWKGYGIAKTSDPALQVEAMARYIKARYGSPSKALAFHYAHNWY